MKSRRDIVGDSDITCRHIISAYKVSIWLKGFCYLTADRVSDSAYRYDKSHACLKYGSKTACGTVEGRSGHRVISEISARLSEAGS